MTNVVQRAKGNTAKVAHLGSNISCPSAHLHDEVSQPRSKREAIPGGKRNDSWGKEYLRDTARMHYGKQKQKVKGS